MEKYNVLKVLEVMYNDTKNTAILLQIGNYTTTLLKMDDEEFNKVKNFYLEFIAKYFQNLIK